MQDTQRDAYKRWLTAGLIFFAHSARDSRWADPFERLRHKAAMLRPGIPVKLAYLELMAPDLPTAIGDDDMVLDRIAAVCVGGAPA